jgi:hypothetical protein
MAKLKTKFILKSKSSGEVDSGEKELNDFLSQYHAVVIDSSMFPMLVLVESDKNLIECVPQSFKNSWEIFPETPVKLPDTRKRIKIR